MTVVSEQSVETKSQLKMVCRIGRKKENTGQNMKNMEGVFDGLLMKTVPLSGAIRHTLKALTLGEII